MQLAPPDSSLPVAPSTDRTSWGRVRAAATLGQAAAERGTPWPQPLAHDAARFHRDGDRRAWEVPAFARTRRLSRAVVAAAITDDPAWLDEVADGVTLVCEQSSWCWPAHDDAQAERGFVVADVTRPYLDLGAGEVAGQLAWLDQVLGVRLDERYPGLRERIRHEARTRVLDPFLNRDDWWWTGERQPPNNWNPWINQNVLAAALRLLDGETDATTRTETVALIVARLDRYVAVIPQDGAIDEGYHYWWAGASRLLETLELLQHATGLDGWQRIPALRETVGFPHRMHLGGEWFVSVADARARSGDVLPWRALHAAARRTADGAAEAFSIAHRDDPDATDLSSLGLGRMLLEIADEDWRGVRGGADPLPETTWLGSTQMLVARERAGDATGLAVVAKAGHNAESHNHNDVGSVIVSSGGVPVVVDAGQPTYTRQTFGPERFSLWMMRSDWHSVPTIAGRTQRPGAQYAATEVTYDGDEGMSMELAAAYGLGEELSWRRSVSLDRTAHEVIVHDSWRMLDGSPAPEPTVVHFLLSGRVGLEPGRAFVRPEAGATPVALTWDASAPASLVVKDLDDPRLAEVWGERLTRLDIDVAARAELTVRVTQQEPDSLTR